MTSDFTNQIQQITQNKTAQLNINSSSSKTKPLKNYIGGQHFNRYLAVWVLKNKLVLYYYYAKNSNNLVSKTAGISSHLAFCLVNLSMHFCAFCFLNTMMFTGPTGMKGHPLLRVQRAGVDYALRLSLSVQQDQYYGSLRDSSGFKVMVHDQEEPPLINELGFAIQPGTHTFCGLRKEVVCTWIVS